MTPTNPSRRSLLTGGFGTSPISLADKAEIVSLIVNVFPAHLHDVSDQIAKLPGAEVHGEDPIGKLIVVLEAATQGEIGTLANMISDMPHVLSAAMVFQATDDASV